MRTRNNTLIIFDNFTCDHNLNGPTTKWRKEKGLDMVQSSDFLTIGGVSFEEDIRLVEYLEYVYSHNRTILNFIKLKLAKTFSANDKTKVVKYRNLDKVFTDVKMNLRELNLPEKTLDFYTEQMEQASSLGQTALVEKLNSGIREVTVEKLLYVNETRKYISETDLLSFVDKHKVPDRLLKLSWIKNYARPIPQEVINIKKTFDKKEVFDNYVILHLDLTGDSEQMTNAEKEKAKDPILFGVVQGSRKLFYVADWMDEYCDLTLDKVLEVLSKEKVDELI